MSAEITPTESNEAPERSFAPPTCSASCLHIWYRLQTGKTYGLVVGGYAPDDAVRCVQSALYEGAIAISIIREDIKPNSVIERTGEP